jgi:hypothetical protein
MATTPLEIATTGSLVSKVSSDECTVSLDEFFSFGNDDVTVSFDDDVTVSFDDDVTVSFDDGTSVSFDDGIVSFDDFLEPNVFKKFPMISLFSSMVILE